MSRANLIVLSPTHAQERQENCPEKPSDYTPAWNVPTTILGSLTLLETDSHSNKLKRNCLFYPSSLNYAYHAFSLYTMSSEKCIIVFWFQYFLEKMSNSNKRFAIIFTISFKQQVQVGCKVQLAKCCAKEEKRKPTTHTSKESALGSW